MEQTKFSKRQLTVIKNTAKIVNPLIVKKEKIIKQIEDLQNELHALTEEHLKWEQGILDMTGGYTTEDLIVKTIKFTDKVDKEGKVIKATKYSFKYPDTIIPPTDVKVLEENTQEPSSEENFTGINL